MQTKRRVAASPQTNPNQPIWAVSPPKDWLLPSADTIAMYYYYGTQLVSWYSCYRPTEGERLSRPRHCSEGAQPVPRAVYCSDCHDKHDRLRWDSNLGPLAPQSGILPLSHRSIICLNNLSTDIHSFLWLLLCYYSHVTFCTTVCLKKKTSPTFLAVTRESIVLFS